MYGQQCAFVTGIGPYARQGGLVEDNMVSEDTRQTSLLALHLNHGETVNNTTRDDSHQLIVSSETGAFWEASSGYNHRDEHAEYPPVDSTAKFSSASGTAH